MNTMKNSKYTMVLGELLLWGGGIWDKWLRDNEKIFRVSEFQSFRVSAKQRGRHSAWAFGLSRPPLSTNNEPGAKISQDSDFGTSSPVYFWLIPGFLNLYFRSWRVTC
jgi:hypothetical protein